MDVNDAVDSIDVVEGYDNHNVIDNAETVEVLDRAAEVLELPEPIVSGTSEERIRRRPRVDYANLAGKRYKPIEAYAYNVSVKKALAENKSKALSAILDELLQIIERGVFIPQKWDTLSPKRKRSCLKSFMFLKQKYTAAGVIDKLKARLVANGKQQNRDDYQIWETSSPTAALTSLFTVAAIAAAEHRHVFTADVKGAFLNGKMPDDKVVDMILDPQMSKILCDQRPEYLPFLRSDGCLIVNLARPLYGTVEAAKIWYDLLTSFLAAEGFEPNEYDRCVWNKGVGKEQVTVVIYVDDMFVTGTNAEDIRTLMEKAKTQFGHVTLHEGTVHNYVGMVFDYSVVGELKVNMTAYEDGCVEVMGITSTSTTPAAESLFKIDDKELLGDKEQTKFHSFVARLLYLAKRTRPDILLPIAFLTTRVKKATKKDFIHLMRVGAYLKGTRGLGIRFVSSVDGVDSMRAFMDAAFGVHFDFKSHTGMVVLLFGGPIEVVSKRQKCVTKSSHEAELIAASDGGSKVIWCRRFLKGQGYAIQSTSVAQDNQATISTIVKGGPTGDRSRHVHIREYWLRQEVEEGELLIEYVPTTEMVADIMTKPLQGDAFFKLRAMLMNWK